MLICYLKIYYVTAGVKKYSTLITWLNFYNFLFAFVLFKFNVYVTFMRQIFDRTVTEYIT